MAETLETVPMGLQAAACVLEGHSQQLTASSGEPEPATEAAGVAAVALSTAFGGFGAVFGHRLSCVSAQLSRAARAYTAMDVAGGQAVRVV